MIDSRLQSIVDYLRSLPITEVYGLVGLGDEEFTNEVLAILDEISIPEELYEEYGYALVLYCREVLRGLSGQDGLRRV
jgi:hypothetical protein